MFDSIAIKVFIREIVRNSRERHIKSVHLGEKSKCVHCEKEYNDTSALRKHNKKYHHTAKEVEDCNN